MSELRQTRFDEVPEGEIIAPNEPHMACLLLLDTSGSMNGAAIASLNESIESFINQTSMDEMAKKRVDVAIVEFNDDVRVVQNFSPISQLEPVKLTAGGCTSMGAAICQAIDMVKERNTFYDNLGTPVFKPWIFMITDGVPTDDISLAVQRIQEEENKGMHGKLKFWSLGVPGYDKNLLKKLSKRVIELNGKNFEGIFNWLSERMVTLFGNRVGENPQFPDLPEDARFILSDWD